MQLQERKCHLDNNCLASNIIYRATIITNNITKFYVSSTSTTFKNRNHKASFNNKLKRHITEISNYIWKIKLSNNKFNLKWEILCRTKIKLKNNKAYNLCSLEKHKIEILKKKLSLNKRKERQQPCLYYQNIYLKEQKY